MNLSSKGWVWLWSRPVYWTRLGGCFDLLLVGYGSKAAPTWLITSTGNAGGFHII